MNLPPIFKSLKFLESLAFVLAAILLVVQPGWGVSAAAILALFVAILKLFGITPELRALMAINYLEVPPIFKLLKFWEFVSLAIAGIIALVRPDLAITAAQILVVILAILALFGIRPELRAKIDNLN